MQVGSQLDDLSDPWPCQAEPSRQSSLPPHRLKLRFRLQIALFLLDIVGLLAAVEMAAIFWLGRSTEDNSGAIATALVGFYILAGVNAGIFGSEMLVRRRRSVLLSMRSALLAAISVILAAFFLKAGAQISRMELLIGGILGAFLVGFLRVLFQGWTRRHYGQGLYSEILVLDDCHVVPPPGTHVIEAAASGLRCDLSDPLMLDRIGRLLAPADRVIVACSMERRRNWAMVLKGANVRAEIISSELNSVRPLGTGQFGDSATLVVAVGSLDLRQRFLKRGLDLSLAFIALILLLPLLVLTALAIRMDSPGPVLFVQDRVGRSNRLFGIYKFRSMLEESADHAGRRSTSRDDDRITRVGRFIRATSIDELPQLLNIFRGEMSFVGPRPHALGSLAGDLLFWEVDERYWHRHVCKPGLTGLAQVRGYRGATHHQSDLADRLQADLEYVSGWTVLRDIYILFATLRVVIHRNAY